MQPLLDQLKGLDVLAGAEMGGRSVQLQPIPGHTPVIQVSSRGYLYAPMTKLAAMCRNSSMGRLPSTLFRTASSPR